MKYSALIIITLLISSFANAKEDECMKHLVPSTIDNSSNIEVVKYIERLKGTVLFSDVETKGSYCYLKNWYEERMSSRQFSSRTLAVLIIALGALLPLIAILDTTFINQKVWIAFIGFVIVVSQGFAQAFQYEESWRSYTVAKLELEGAHRDWQNRIVNVAMANDGIEDAKSATELFSDSISKIVLKETTGFFDNVSSAVKRIKSD